MNIIIAGSRTISNVQTISGAIHEGLTTLMGDRIPIKDYEKLVIFSGGAKGVDTEAEKYAKFLGIKFVKFPANWQKYGKKAGVLRNLEMAKKADALIAIWDGKSRGTANMLIHARNYNLKIFLYQAKDFEL